MEKNKIYNHTYQLDLVRNYTPLTKSIILNHFLLQLKMDTIILLRNVKTVSFPYNMIRSGNLNVIFRSRKRRRPSLSVQLEFSKEKRGERKRKTGERENHRWGNSGNFESSDEE